MLVSSLRQLRRILVGLTVPIAMTGAAVAGSPEDATAALREGDYTTALGLSEPLAEQGNAEAQYDLGFMYAIGIGVPQDFVLAYKWLNLAAARGYTDAVSYRERVSSLMTPDQIAEAQRLVRGWKPTTEP